MYKGNIFLTTDNNRAVAGSMELRIYGITEFSYRLRVRQRQLMAHCSVLTAQSLYAFRLLPLNLSREATRSLVDS